MEQLFAIVAIVAIIYVIFKVGDFIWRLVGFIATVALLYIFKDDLISWFQAFDGGTAFEQVKMFIGNVGDWLVGVFDKLVSLFK